MTGDCRLPEWNTSVEKDMTARLSLEVVTTSHSVRVVTLDVVGLHAPLHGHDSSQRPEVRPALARVRKGPGQDGSSRREVSHSVDSLQHLHRRPQAIVICQPDVLVELLPRSVLVVLPDPLPIKAAVTASSPV